jgi:hypothetical protein
MLRTILAAPRRRLVRNRRRLKKDGRDDAERRRHSRDLPRRPGATGASPAVKIEIPKPVHKTRIPGPDADAAP